ncbi:MAG: nitrile hydratase subunit alpha [Acetobacteraceae bacterium]
MPRLDATGWHKGRGCRRLFPNRRAAARRVGEPRPETQHLIVCTLCSCYPRALLGIPPFWYKSPAYRSRAVCDPRGLLAEWGTIVPAHVNLRVLDSTADYRWMVLPMRPSGTEGWDEGRLASLVGAEELIEFGSRRLPALSSAHRSG